MTTIVDNKVKLNLGCGHKLWDGFINIDHPDGNYSGAEPDVKCDIKHLPFEDNYADEIHAIHVIEHIYLWEVEATLKEWLRVLRPGGLLVLELPNLEKVTYHLVKGIQEGRMVMARTLWALFGNPEYENIPMLHKWCYFPSDMIDRLKRAGFDQMAFKEPQFHKPDRDMRIEAQKPSLIITGG
jgi:predicted SAM-dependent methyltransferase